MKQVKEISINLEVQIYIDNINYTMFQVVGSYIHFTEKVTFGWDSIYIGWPPSVQIQLPKYEGKYDTIKVTSDI